ncbi:hypothetical protein C2S52_004298 [Perilla frutescens var. hirtella]|nr:hypothetical protein C2S51_011273 [Perilla frutescens var. frutescens]KAH6793821.1 hypothetical protein C2S52_004298 [Perilla frutescens var. hirtella]
MLLNLTRMPTSFYTEGLNIGEKYYVLPVSIFLRTLLQRSLYSVAINTAERWPLSTCMHDIGCLTFSSFNLLGQSMLFCMSASIGNEIDSAIITTSLSDLGTVVCFENLYPVMLNWQDKMLNEPAFYRLLKIGQGLAAFGFIFTLIGVMLFFDKGFLAIGNILLLSGFILTAGLSSSMLFFLKPKNYKGTILLVLGFFLVVTGCPMSGLFLETCGFIFLFRELWPTIANFLRRLPFLGSLVLRQSCSPPYFARSRGMRCPV